TAVVGIGVLLASGQGEKEKPQHPGQAEDVSKGWEFSGRTQAVATVEVRALMTGPLTRLAVKEGTAVKKGDLLAEILSRPYQLDLDAARARWKGADAKLQVAKIETANARKLFQQ